MTVSPTAQAALAAYSRARTPAGVASDETVILLHPPLSLLKQLLKVEGVAAK